MRGRKRGKGKSVSLLGRFYRYKYSGLIVVPTIAVAVMAGWFYAVESLEFFDTWSCQTLENYMLYIDVPDEFPKHHELDPDQHIKLHKIYQECLDSDEFRSLTPHE